ncbi:winged helix DNA-binding domain-containing protein [Virgisporangium ochraceum]|uniref:Winged helix DNA-binding domain-containing protein n=1 Tax=Virgisporangium ochraceum TaxID=65505 RepID=A0A8J3ZPH8_9ACTN|nr:winged helix DNA-binding domain-containing protein [Virgisporangium ochraceum]GIJ65513.1 hypothetical protein Voc01_004300 [Virgisporangium ochraceum]
MDISTRQLNRTFLQRQFLLEPSRGSVADVVAHLVALQAQETDAPYIGLWTRMATFGHADLTTALVEREVVRGSLLRVTQHITSGDDYRWLRPLLAQRLGKAGLSAFARDLDGLDLAEVAAAGRDILAGQTLTRPALARQLGERYPGRSNMPLAWAVQRHLPLVHPPPTGVWRRRGHVACALAEDWVGPLEERPSLRTLVWRYLASCGPASVADLQVWSGLRRLKAEVEALRPELTVYRDARGRELFDIPGLPVAGGDEPAPVRFLPEFDNAVLSHDDRSRIVADEDRPRVFPGYSMVHATFLVDGFVAGIWELAGGELRVTPFRPLASDDADAVRAEADRLLPFLDLGDGARVVFA